jgi:hypothetical protein
MKAKEIVVATTFFLVVFLFLGMGSILAESISLPNNTLTNTKYCTWFGGYWDGQWTTTTIDAQNDTVVIEGVISGISLHDAYLEIGFITDRQYDFIMTNHPTEPEDWFNQGAYMLLYEWNSDGNWSWAQIQDYQGEGSMVPLTWTTSYNFQAVFKPNVGVSGGIADLYVNGTLVESNHVYGTPQTPGWWSGYDTTGEEDFSDAHLIVQLWASNSGKSVSYSALSAHSISPPTEVWVDDDFDSSTPGWGYDHFDNIQDGIDSVVAGGTVNVAAGSYPENVQIAKSVALVGATGAEIVPTAAEAVYISADDVTIQGFDMHGCEQGILVWLDDTHYNTNFGYSNLHILDNTIYDISPGAWGFGIYIGTESERYNPSHAMYDPALTDLLNFTGLQIVGNEIYNTSGASIVLQSIRPYDANPLLVSENYIHDNAMSAIWIDAAWDVGVSSSRLNANANGIFFSNYGDGYYEVTPDNAFDPKNIQVTENEIHSNSSVGLNIWDGYPGQIHFHHNSIVGNGTGLDNHLSPVTDASGNWWGDNTPAGVPGVIAGNADYTPWLHDGTDQSGDPGFQPDLSYLHVDDDSPQSGPADRIQEGIDMASSSTVELEAGTYVEQVYITEDDFVLLGSGVENTTIKSPAALTHYFTTGSNSNYPVVFVDEATGVGISDLTIDGDHQGNANYRFIGLGFWNGDGSLTDAKVLNIMDNPFSGAQHGVGIYSYNDDDGPYTIVLDNVFINDFQKNAVALLGTGLTVDIDDVTTTGEGPTSVTAQNGIQIGPGVGGTVDDCSISGVAYTGATWTATGFLNWGNVTATGLDIDQCQTSVYWTDGSGTFTGGTITNPIGDGFYAYNSTAKGNKQLRVSPQPYDGIPTHSSKEPMSVTLSNTVITGTGAADSWGVGAFSTSADAVNLTVTGCLITNWDYGVYSYDYGGPVTCSVNWNSIAGNTSYGLYNATATEVDAEYNSWGSVDGPEDLTGSEEAQLDECYDVSTMVNAVAELSGSLGNAVSENADYCPWLGGDAGFDAEIYAGCNDPCDDFCLDFKMTGTDIRFFHFEYPLPTCIVKTTVSAVHTDLVTFQGTMFGNVLHIDGNFDPNFTGTNVKIGEICFSHDGTCPNSVQTLTCTADEVRDGSGSLVDVTPGLAIINVDNTAPTKDHLTGDILPCYSASDDPDWGCWNLSFYKGTEEWQCDLLQATIRIYSAPGCNSGDLVFTHDFFTSAIPGDFSICYPTNQAERDAIWAALASDGTYYVRLTVTDDCCNEADNCDAFTFCKDTYTDNYFTCVDARPAHNHICLQWDYTSDPVEAVKCKILRSPYRAGNYPEYAASDPVPTGHDDPNWYIIHEGTDTYPCAGGSWYNDDGTGCNGGGTSFDNSTRDIYWYAGFTKDAAGNWSAVNMTLGTGADRMTSYWLGDVTDIAGVGGPDGLVFGFTGDVGRLTSAYGTVSGAPFWDNTVDYGPETEDHGIGRGIPQPDDVINYLDLKPFSFNYNMVGASGDCDTWPLLHQDQPRNLKTRLQDVAVWLEKIPGASPHKDLTLALMLKNPDDATHLLHSRISYNPCVLSLAEVRRGEIYITPGYDEFFASPMTDEGVLDIDLAGLGPDAYLVGSGAVAYLDFKVMEAGAPSEVWLKEAILFDGEGNEIPLVSQNVEIDGLNKSRPADFALYQNHPNPFNPTTIIKFDLPQACNVKLVVYNLRGQKVATLVEGVMEAGKHQVTWNANELSSGIYFYKLVADKFTKMHKMMLLK